MQEKRQAGAVDQQFHKALGKLEQSPASELVLGVRRDRDAGQFWFQLAGRKDQRALGDQVEQNGTGGQGEQDRNRQQGGFQHPANRAGGRAIGHQRGKCIGLIDQHDKQGSHVLHAKLTSREQRDEKSGIGGHDG